MKRNRQNEEKADYTQDLPVRWFTLLMVLVAAFIIIDTLN